MMSKKPKSVAPSKKTARKPAVPRPPAAKVIAPKKDRVAPAKKAAPKESAPKKVAEKKPTAKSAAAIARVKKAAERTAKVSAAAKRAAARDARTAPEMYFNRELSWLDFNARVLALAINPNVPLGERLKFLSIFSTNLDEFYMVRVAGLREQLRARSRKSGPDGLRPELQLDAISKRVRELCAEQTRVWRAELSPALEGQHIELARPDTLSPGEKLFLNKYFTRQVLPVLTPMAVDPSHPFPHLANKSLSLVVVLEDEQRDGLFVRPMYAFVEVPSVLPRFVALRNRRGLVRYVLLEDVVAMHLPLLFAGSKVVENYPLRVTRDSDLEIDEEDAEDLLKVIEDELRQRQWGNVVRLEISNRTPESLIAYLVRMLEIEKRDVVPLEGPLNFGDFMELYKQCDSPELRYEPYTPLVRATWKQSANIFDHIRSGDVMVHHPYESFSSVVDFIEAAAVDRDVLAIKITLYRTSAESPIARSLIKAAQNGKQVVALVELKARFDEAANIQWARVLEREGVHVVYGIVGFKTHCKACLVVRRDGKYLRRYCHLATGNYNPSTASMYTDVGLFTANEALGEDVSDLFNMLTGFASQYEWNALVVAPTHLHSKLMSLIRDEIGFQKRGTQGHIICKMNSLVEPRIIEALYEASQAGVKVDLIVRGICALRPGVPGISDNIRVMSIVGRFLEHSRIFYFSHGVRPVCYCASADFMQRNFFSRIETMFPLLDLDLRNRVVNEILGSALHDTTNAWDLRSDGTWRKRHDNDLSSGRFNSHQYLIEIEKAAAAGALPDAHELAQKR